jgi:hypothetical protein
MKLHSMFRVSIGFCAFTIILALQGAPMSLANPQSPPGDRSQALAQSQSPAVDPQAEELLQAMSNLLESSSALAFTVEETRNILTSRGLPLQLSHVIEVVAQRPDKLWLSMNGDVAERTFWDNGINVTLFDQVNNIFATLPAPGDLTETISTMINTYGVDLPMAQTVRSDLYGLLTEDLQQGYYVGLSTTGTNGRACHLILGISEDIDWQIWIEDGDVPLPCKSVITYKNKEGNPTITSNFTHWNLDPVIPADLFTASVPVGTEQVEFRATDP